MNKVYLLVQHHDCYDPIHRFTFDATKELFKSKKEAFEKLNDSMDYGEVFKIDLEKMTIEFVEK